MQLVTMPEMDEAVQELANVARSLLERLREIDTKMPGSVAEALDNKISFYAARTSTVVCGQ